MTPTGDSKASLYKRLGGYDVIAAVIDEVYARLKLDAQFNRYMTRSADSRNRARQLLVDQVAALAGGPCVYIGRDMKTSHAGLGITEAEWKASIAHTRAALEKNGVTDPEKAEFVALFERYRDDIVEG